MMMALYDLSVAALFGGMLFFSAVLAPLVFTKLPAEVAGGFIRQVFPWYYLFILITSALAVLSRGLVDGATLYVGLLTAISVASAYCRWVLMPQINRLRDAQLAGDEASGKSFDLKHRLSVIINAIQLLLAGLIIGWT
jgi:hypothetical protein